MMVAILCLLATSRIIAQNIQLTPDNIDGVLKTMTLEEKATLLVGKYNKMFSSNGSYIGGQADLVPGAAGETQAIPRLGITPMVLTDGPAGVRINATRPGSDKTYYGTGFPVCTALAATWNTDLVAEVGKAMGNEVREYGCDIYLAPGMNIQRNPLCGRNFEYFSEDPVVSGHIAAAYVNGVQSEGVGASIKHFAANNQETNRTQNNSVVSQRALREIYLKGFEIAVKLSDPWTVMSSYNRLNGPFTQENDELLTTVLRNEWGFKGLVVTDWTDPRNTAAQIAAGNDLMEPGKPVQSQEIIEKVKNGLLPIEAVDKCVRRMLELIVKTPRFRQYKYTDAPDLKAHAAIARQSAAESMVLLKNRSGALPLHAAQPSDVHTPTNKIASMMDYVDPATRQPLNDGVRIALFGINAYDLICNGSGSGDVNKAYEVSLYDGLKEAGYNMGSELPEMYEKYRDFQQIYMRSDIGFVWEFGKKKIPELAISQDLAQRKAQQADVAIIYIGRNAGENYDRSMEGDFNITIDERNLLQNVCDAFHGQGKQAIVVLNAGGAIETSSWKDQADAILLAWQPGQEGGNAIADILSGKINPSGKLTSTFPVTCMDHLSSMNFPIYQIPTFHWNDNSNIRNVAYTEYQEGIYVGYRYFQSAQKETSFPFGFGLSYTTFRYGKPIVKSTKEGFEADITITNTGNVAGKEVVQLYVTAPAGEVEKPASELKGFGKTRELQPGESQTLTIKVNNYDLASYVESRHSWVADAGKYHLKFASNVNDVRANAAYMLGKAHVTACHDVLRPENPIKEFSLKK